MASTQKNSTSDQSVPPLEVALERLEEIVSGIEVTPPPLEELIDRYEEGMKLLQACRTRLDAAEKRIELITRNAKGEAVLEPFETE
jgi:exodeoxyribonuclease VII small subunit